MVFADLLTELLCKFAELRLLVWVENQSLVGLIGIDAVSVSLEADILLVEVVRVDCVWLEIAGKVLFAFIRLFEAHEVVVFLQLSILL